jgi:hypothetical protein
VLIAGGDDDVPRLKIAAGRANAPAACNRVDPGDFGVQTQVDSVFAGVPL